jgi:hypothetical protein
MTLWYARAARARFATCGMFKDLFRVAFDDSQVHRPIGHRQGLF